jgi:hypothetical protein
MEIGKAIEIIERIAKEQGERLLETLMYMKDNLDDFEDDERLAFRTFMRHGMKMFA